MKPSLLSLSIFLWLSNLSPSSAAPSGVFLDDISNASHPFFEYGLVSQKRADKVPLRILSLGASIMSGVGSSTGNGYVAFVIRLNQH